MVIDSYTIITFLFKEPGFEKLVSLLDRAIESNKILLISSPSWSEVRYIVERKSESVNWNEVKNKILSLPIQIVEVDQALAELAAEIKLSHDLSFTNCFTAALAKQKKLEIYTGDLEFQNLETDLKIVFLLEKPGI